MSFCVKCGNSIQQSAAFCGSCGTSVQPRFGLNNVMGITKTHEVVVIKAVGALMGLLGGMLLSELLVLILYLNASPLEQQSNSTETWVNSIFALGGAFLLFRLARDWFQSLLFATRLFGMAFVTNTFAWWLLYRHLEAEPYYRLRDTMEDPRMQTLHFFQWASLLATILCAATCYFLFRKANSQGKSPNFGTLRRPIIQVFAFAGAAVISLYLFTFPVIGWVAIAALFYHIFCLIRAGAAPIEEEIVSTTTKATSDPSTPVIFNTDSGIPTVSDEMTTDSSSSASLNTTLFTEHLQVDAPTTSPVLPVMVNQNKFQSLLLQHKKKALVLVAVLFICLANIVLNRPFGSEPSTYEGETPGASSTTCHFVQHFTFGQDGNVWRHEISIVTASPSESCGDAFERKFK